MKPCELEAVKARAAVSTAGILGGKAGTQAVRPVWGAQATLPKLSIIQFLYLCVNRVLVLSQGAMSPYKVTEKGRLELPEGNYSKCHPPPPLQISWRLTPDSNRNV